MDVVESFQSIPFIHPLSPPTIMILLALFVRLKITTRGHGAFSTSNPADKPFYIAAYITGLAHCDTSTRMSLERDWRNYRNNLNNNSVCNIVDCGERVVADVNADITQLGGSNRLVFDMLVVPEVLLRQQYQTRHRQRQQRWQPHQQQQP